MTPEQQQRIEDINARRKQIELLNAELRDHNTYSTASILRAKLEYEKLVTAENANIKVNDDKIAEFQREYEALGKERNGLINSKKQKV